jgi:hypothetical protein
MPAAQCHGTRAAGRRTLSGARRAWSAAPPRGRARRSGKRGERWFLDLPCFHGGAFVVAYVEDTSARGLHDCDECNERENFEPRTILEIADCNDRIALEFEIYSDARRANSLYKLDTLVAALRVFRKGLEEEFAEYDRREQELKELKGE